MTDSHIAPYGAWKSPITADLIVSESIVIGSPGLEGQDIYWIERRPSEDGRNVIVRRSADGTLTDITPLPFNARTAVHEYGGGVYAVSEGIVYFSNFADQRLYRVAPDSAPEPMTPVAKLRYADPVVDRQRRHLICVCEDHTQAEHEAINKLVSLPLDPDSHEGMQVLASGNDFYASPRLSPDGSHLAWLTWNHPNMPWDGTELWVGELAADGSVGSAQCVAGSSTESIFQPEWSPDGVLHFVSDRTGWWNLYRWRNGQIEPLCEKSAEFGRPQWLFALSTYAFVSPEHIICSYIEQGIGSIASLDTATGELTPIKTPYSTFTYIQASAEYAVFHAASPTLAGSLIQLDLVTNKIEVLRCSSNVAVDAAYLSVPQLIEFPTEQERTAYAFFYPPRNPDYNAPATDLPPLLVGSHGGPTSATTNALDLNVQFWTSRGFAVLDVNYGGSTGYGREYRDRLRGQWGIVDIDDCVNGARYLVERGLVDGNRLAIRGGSAGGYTTLGALTFRNVFHAGASYFGVSDIEGLALDTHKFESRYCDYLVGPYPQKRDLYIQRSPIHFTDRLSCPVIFFQGLEDKVVLPNQAERMVEALRAKKVPVAYIPFKGEQHGFRRAENIKCALESELYFYAKIFGFEPADSVEPVKIENLA